MSNHRFNSCELFAKNAHISAQNTFKRGQYKPKKTPNSCSTGLHICFKNAIPIRNNDINKCHKITKACRTNEDISLKNTTKLKNKSN